MFMKLVALLALGLFLAAQQHYGAVIESAQVDFNNPVRSAEEDEIKKLPGLDFELGFKQYSGYLEADDKKNRFWHYWFVESQGNPSTDPLVLWLNGGPGCSSLLGLLTELGPIRVSDNNTIISNPYAWNKNANVIFMESPAGVGFSYAADGSIKADDDTTAAQNHHALKSFLNKFPQYKKSDLYLTGESYGGVYLPTLAVLVDKDPEMNLKGVAIGNGYLDANKLAESLIYFGYYHGLFGKKTWADLSNTCCDGKPPARGDCHFMDPNRSLECAAITQTIGDLIINSGVNPYNLYDKCYSSSSAEEEEKEQKLDYNVLVAGKLTHRSLGHEDSDRGFIFDSPAAPANQKIGREYFDRRMMMRAFNYTDKTPSFSRTWKRDKIVKNLGGDPPCTDDRVVIRYLNQQTVRDALHIPKQLTYPFATCFDGIDYKMIYPSAPDGLAPQIRSLIDSPRGLSLLIYNGDVDLMCNFFGDEWFVDDLKRDVKKEYTQWYTNKQVSGFIKKFDGITYMTVKGSGHMVPTDKPAEALNMFEMFLSGDIFE